MADLLFLLVCIPYETVFKISGYLNQGILFCKAAGFVEIFTTAASIWNLTFVSIERYIGIVHGLRYRMLCSMGRTRKTIIVIWIIAAAIAIPNSAVQDVKTSLFYNNESYVRAQSCGDFNFNSNSERIVFVYYHLVLLFVIPVLIMAFCYSRVIRVLWLSTKQLDHMTGTGQKYSSSEATSSNQLKPPSRSGQGQRKALKVKSDTSPQTRDLKEGRKQVIKMLLTIIAIFFLCWGPKLILNVLIGHECEQIRTPGAFYAMLVINLLPYLQSATNPVIYGFMSNNFRRSLRSVSMRYCKPCARIIADDTGKASSKHMRMESTKTNYSASATSGYSTQTTTFIMPTES